MKVSIVTAVLNDVSHIRETVESVLQQELPPGSELEYILIDGGSTDGTLEILQEFRDRFAVFVSEPDHGIYEAMNKGIAKAAGDVAGIINSGDRYFPGALAKVIEAFSRCPTGEERIFWGDVEYEKLGRVRGFRPEKLQIGAFAPHPSMFVPLALYRKYGSYDESFRLMGDYEFMYRMIHVNRVTPLYVPELIAFYRAGGVSDRRIAACLREELRVKQRWGKHPHRDRLLWIAKIIKNLPRMALAKMHKYGYII